MRDTAVEWIYPFNTAGTPEVRHVGGKGMSLIAMTRDGLPVPPGFVLSVEFFQPWLEEIQATEEWQRTLQSSSDQLGHTAADLVQRCMTLQLDDERRQALSQALQRLQGFTFAIRSSSPEEDLEQASFAGGYHTSLGVLEQEIEDAIQRSFASLFDERVFVYKREHGFAVDQAQIAVVVQAQLAADVAGVAFSLNPVNNCYDEAVIDANFGLGESVVSGLASPDSFVVDKPTATILERRLGKKETSIWLAANGGTCQEPAANRGILCLSDKQVLQITEALLDVENRFQKPIDIEWALVDGSLYLLQARPITAYYQIPKAMATAPGEPKRLYADLTLIKWGMQEPVSVMGTDYLGIVNRKMMEFSFGKSLGTEVGQHLRVTANGRTYVAVSTSMKMQGKDRVVGEFRAMDALSASILSSIDEREYVPRSLPPAFRGLMLKLIRNYLGIGWNSLRAFIDPEGARHRYVEAEQRARTALRAMQIEQMPIRQVAEQTMDVLIDSMESFFPTIAAAELAKSRIERLFKDDEPAVRDKIAYLERALPDNVTIRMGLEMYQLSRFPEILECPSAEAFAVRLQQRDFSAAFLQAWDSFMAEFGFRSPMEMDPAAPRYYERPRQFFEQLLTMARNTDPQYNPQSIYERAKAQREQAYEELLCIAQQKGRRKASSFQKNYRIMVELAGYRESPKYQVAWITDIFRRHVLAAAKPLIMAGRLHHSDEAFHLTIDDFERGLVDPSLDLRGLAWKNTRYLRRLEGVRAFPRVIDSRGKVLRPPSQERGADELIGQAISPGVVSGPAKVLNTPDEKPVMPGDVLVARATDPGWTPLFLNAAGIILEVGGMLQHGALIAREYGKPCVAGVENATSLLRDGQAVEVDGSSGVVRLV